MPIIDPTPYENLLGRIGRGAVGLAKQTPLVEQAIQGYQTLRHPFAGMPSGGTLVHDWMHPVQTDQEIRQQLPRNPYIYKSVLPLPGPETVESLGGMMAERAGLEADAEIPRILGDVRDAISRGRTRYIEPVEKAAKATEPKDQKEKSNARIR